MPKGGIQATRNRHTSYGNKTVASKPRFSAGYDDFCALFTGNLCTDVDETYFHYSICAKDGYRQLGTVILCVLELKWWPLKTMLEFVVRLKT